MQGDAISDPAASSIVDPTAGPGTSTSSVDSKAPEAAFKEAVDIMRRLRSADGCPWDREQTFDSIKRHTLEETYEVFDAIERRHWPDLKDELGDLLLQVLFYSQMADEAGYFDIGGVVANLNEKLVRRHPHVFGDAQARDTDAVLRNWETIKKREKRERVGVAEQDEGGGVQEAKGLLDEIPRSMPAMMEAGKLGSRAAKVGFDWPNADGLFDKLAEETGELKQAMAEGSVDAVDSELGDLLFTVVNLARHLKVDPESALRSTNAKFRRRFAWMEAQAAANHLAQPLAGLSADELEGLWRLAKQREARG